MTDFPTDVPGFPGDLPGGDDLDLAAIAADDALLDRLGAGWGDDVPAEITDAVIWDDQPPAKPPVKKGRAEDDEAARILSIVRADAEVGIAAAVASLASAVPGSTWAMAPGSTWAAAPGSQWASTPGSQWARRARRTGVRGIAVAAAVVVSLGGVAAASVGAGPGATFYPVHRFFAGPDPQAEEAYAVRRATEALDDVDQALVAHQVAAARGKLTAAAARLQAVTVPSDKAPLTQRYDGLAAIVAAAEAAKPTVPKPSDDPTESEGPTTTRVPGTTSGGPSSTDSETPSHEPSTRTSEPTGDSHSPSAEPSHGGSDGKSGQGIDGSDGHGSHGNDGKDGKSKDGKSKGGTSGKDKSGKDGTSGSGHGKDGSQGSGDTAGGSTTGTDHNGGGSNGGGDSSHSGHSGGSGVGDNGGGNGGGDRGGNGGGHGGN